MEAAPVRNRVLMEVQNDLDTQRTPNAKNRLTPATPKIRRPILPKEALGSSPISPMANLKLLSNAASVISEVPPSQATNEKYSRRLRSLSFICNKFLEIYRWDLPEGKSESISLVSLASRLGIKKRRVYDIINVVSSLNLAVKVCKDRYYWFGAQNLLSSLTNLKAYGLQNNFHIQLRNLLNTMPELNWTATKRPHGSSGEALKENQSLRIPEPVTRAPFDHNRIGILCQKFIMLFLVAEPGMSLSLLLLSKLILSPDIQYKTGVRRLYDVANALEALNLIAKSDEPTARRPSFVYKGPRVDSSVAPGAIVEYIGDNSVSAGDSEMDCSCDTSIDSFLDVGCDVEVDEAPELFSSVDADSSEEKPAAKKRLVFPSESADEGPSSADAGLSDSVVPQSNLRSTKRESKPVLLSSLSSRLLDADEAAYYRSKITSSPSQPTFIVLRATNQLTLRLK